MENLEEFEIIKIEKDLKEEKRLIITASTLHAISSTIFMSLGLFYAYKHQLAPAVLEGIASLGLGMSAGMKMNEIENIDTKIKSLRK